jgi:hypothetical protein
MDYLFKNGVHLHVFGPGWDKVGRKKPGLLKIFMDLYMNWIILR